MTGFRVTPDGQVEVDMKIDEEHAPLSEREREILQLLAEGLHTEEVADRIGLSAETVKSDTKRVIAKLQADTRTHAVAIALRQAIIE